MLYKCVDSNGPHKRIIVDLLDIIENPAKSCSQDFTSLLSESNIIRQQNTNDLNTPIQDDIT